MKPSPQAVTDLTRTLAFVLRAMAEENACERTKLEMRRDDLRAPNSEIAITFSPMVEDATIRDRALQALTAIVESFEATYDVRLGRIVLEWVLKTRECVPTEVTFLEGR